MKEVKIEAYGSTPVVVYSRNNRTLIIRQEDDLIAWPIEAIPDLIAALQQLQSPNH